MRISADQIMELEDVELEDPCSGSRRMFTTWRKKGSDQPRTSEKKTCTGELTGEFPESSLIAISRDRQNAIPDWRG